VRITNLTRGKQLADKAWEATKLKDRMKGLLGRKGLEPGEAIFIRPCTSIHSFFMKFVFDAAFVNAAGVVLHVIHSMKPWRMSKMVSRAVGVVELPKGVLRETGTEVGDHLEFVG